MSSKKRVKKSTGNHANDSFANLVGKAQTASQKAYIDQAVSIRLQQLAQPMFQQITKLVLDHIGQVQTRQLAVERLLSVDSDKLAVAVADVEDEARGYVVSTEAAKEGSLVRISTLSKAEDDEDFGDEEKIQINELLKKDPNGNVQTLIEIETNLVGLKTGESKQFVIPAESEEGKATVMKVTVVRISEKVETENDSAE